MNAMIGLEVHVYVKTQSKLFCTCSAEVQAASAANTNVCHVCTGQPGAKPQAPNAAAFVAGVRLALALGMDLAASTRFLRKHYFYPDLPSNYQRTSEPLATGGSLAGSRLTELHVEEDPGTFDLATGRVDYNRSGAPLLELVGEPDLTSPAHARQFLNELRLALAYLDIGRGEAGIKADCNVSIDGGARVEVKNVNSVRNVERALAYEIERQEKEGAVRETRHFDEATGRTSSLRAKESAADYRFLVDPDLRSIDIASLARALPTEASPFARRSRIATLAGVDDAAASPLFEERSLVDLYESAHASDPKTTFTFLVRDLRGELDFRKTTLAACGVPLPDIRALLDARGQGKISPQVATRLLRHAFDAGGLGDALTRELGANTDGGDILDAARAAVAANPKAVADWRSGKATAVNFLVGQTMRALRGRGDPGSVKAAVEAALHEP